LNPQYNFRTDLNSNAQGLWLHMYIDGDKKAFVRDAFTKLLKRNAKGVIK